MSFESIQEIIEIVYLENTIGAYLLFVGIVILGLALKRVIANLLGFIIFKVFKKLAQEVRVKEFNKLVRKPLSFFIMLLFIFLACQQLKYPESWHLVAADEFGVKMALYAVFETLLISSIIWLGMRIIDFLGLIFIRRALKDDNKANDYIIPFAVDIVKILVVVLGLFIILGTVFQLNIGSLIAGLGIGGLAVALAAKETLENLFGSFTIFIDKPFLVGDWIKIGDTEGVVEKIGFRSTRIRTFEKSYVTIPNKMMIDAELDNMTMRTAMRAKFFIGVCYSTKAEQIRLIMTDIEKALAGNEKTNENFTVRLSGFGASSLDILVIFYVKTENWAEYMQIKEEFNFRIMEIVQAHGADFAFPSTSVYIEKQ